MQDWLQSVWWRTQPPPLFLRGLSHGYSAVADYLAERRRARAQHLPVPVIVVGNIAVGGTGKTPITLWLVQTLKAMGQKPGIISRGYGGKGPFPYALGPSSQPTECGDEPLLLARRSGVPVVVAPRRVEAAQQLLQRHPDTTVLVCDDGLQHYPLARSLEIAVIDGPRGHGNGWRLPAGPLREPTTRLAECDLVLVNGANAQAFNASALRFDLRPSPLVNLVSGEQREVNFFAGQSVHALAGIGHPERFFSLLTQLGLRVIRHPKPDHYAYQAADVQRFADAPIVMTEKDAVKCQNFAPSNSWMLPVSAEFAPAAAAQITHLLSALFQKTSF